MFLCPEYPKSGPEPLTESLAFAAEAEWKDVGSYDDLVSVRDHARFVISR
jgi:hypothetical protein